MARRPAGVPAGELPLLLGEPEARSRELAAGMAGVSSIGRRYLSAGTVVALSEQALALVRAYPPEAPRRAGALARNPAQGAQRTARGGERGPGGADPAGAPQGGGRGRRSSGVHPAPGSRGRFAGADTPCPGQMEGDPPYGLGARTATGPNRAPFGAPPRRPAAADRRGQERSVFFPLSSYSVCAGNQATRCWSRNYPGSSSRPIGPEPQVPYPAARVG